MSRQRGLVIFVSTVAVGALVCLYAFVDPLSTGWMPKCMFRYITGLDCPGCGSQRALHSLLNGNISAAWEYNALVVLAIPLIIPLGWVAVTKDKHPQLYRRLNSVPVAIAISVIITAWFIYRNFL